MAMEDEEVAEIDRLPIDLLSHIFFPFDSFTDLAQASCVSKKWRKAVKQSIGRRESLNFSGWKMDDDSTARLVSVAFSLKELDMYNDDQVDQWRVNENEEIDCAIALSLAAEEEKRKRTINSGFQLKEDEQLARALQESFSSETRPQSVDYGGGNYGLPIMLPFSTGYRVCAGCNNEIGFWSFLKLYG